MKQVLILGLLTAGCLTGPDLGGMPVHSLTIDGPLRLSARSEYGHDTLRIIVSVRNVGTTPGELHRGVCSFAVRGLSVSGEAWDNRLPPNGACIDLGIILPVGPGEARETSAWRFWGEALPPPGRYRISVFYKEGDDLKHLTAGAVTIPPR